MIKVNKRMNIEFMRSLLVDYKDKEICDLEFGLSLGCQENETLLNDIQKKTGGNIETTDHVVKL